MPNSAEPRWWVELDPVWRRCYELAWLSFAAGSPPVGAVVIDAGGRIVAEGRSQRGEGLPVNVNGPLAGSAIAHAEMNALACLPPTKHQDKVLRTTLQSCLVCVAATMMSHLGHLEYATRDPLWDGLHSMRTAAPVIQDRWVDQHGPLRGPAAAFAATTVILELLESNQRGSAMQAYRKESPEMVDAATSIRDAIPTGSLREWPLAKAVRELTPYLS